ncbi:hypothetical protein [Xanthomonas vasicola]|uniref:hypothetical protein n=1 Tax=Xanthomonas vasicola TaxID=56459 RepID=UPI000AD49B38|nr:hypothetical protein [Xanthomonas vasicola]
MALRLRRRNFQAFAQHSTKNPINDTGYVTFQTEDRGATLGVLAASMLIHSRWFT